MGIINPNKVIIQDVPRPTSVHLKRVVEKLWEFCIDHLRDLNTQKPDTLDKYYAGCIKVASSNLKAVIKLDYMYFEECNAISRNLVETCVDYFWLAGVHKKDPKKAKRLAENYFLFSNFVFLRDLEFNKRVSKKDIFLRDLTLPFGDEKIVVKCKRELGNRIFVNTWRHEKGLFTDSELRWKKRAEIAKEFVEKEQNFKSAPYYQNLNALSAFSHFDPIQLQDFGSDKNIKQIYYDRLLNIMIGHVFDMVVFSFKRKNWKPAEALLMLQHKFCWFST